MKKAKKVTGGIRMAAVEEMTKKVCSFLLHRKQTIERGTGKRFLKAQRA